MGIFKLIRAFQKTNGRSPTPSELDKLKQQADIMSKQENVIPFPQGGKDKLNPFDDFKASEDAYEQAQKLTPIEAMKEANNLIGRKGKYKNISSKDAKKKLGELEEIIKSEKLEPEDLVGDDLGDMLKDYDGDPDAMAGGGLAGALAKLKKKYGKNIIQKGKAPKKSKKKETQDMFREFNRKNKAAGGLAYMLGEPRSEYSGGGDAGAPPITYDDNVDNIGPGPTMQPGFMMNTPAIDPRMLNQSRGSGINIDPRAFQNGRLPEIPTQGLADGGRIGFKEGGPPNPGRRNFLKLMGGLAALPVVGKFFKFAKPAAKTVVPLTNTSTAMPAWFPKFVDKVIDKGVGTKIDADIMKYETKELPGIQVTKHDDGRIYVEGQNDYGKSYDIEYQPPGYEVVDYKTGKAVKTKGDFTASEEVPVSMDMDGNADFEGEILEKVDDILGGDARTMQEFATGRKIKIPTRGEKRVGQAEVMAENAADEAAERAAMEADDFASGGLAKLLGE